MKSFVCWLPRILSILFIAFISVFALDAFASREWVLALTMHLLPSVFLGILTAITWKHERTGGVLFLLIGIAVLVASSFEAFIIGVPAIVIGALFLVGGSLRNM